jgi:hypothetical protein
VLRASRQENQELFWALRGGKVGLGAVSRVRLRLIPLADLYAAQVVYLQQEELLPVLRGWLEWTRSAPSRVSTSVLLVRPSRVRNHDHLYLRFVFPGPPAEGEALLAPLESLGRSSVHLFSAGELAVLHRDPDEPGPFWVSGMLLSRADGDFAEVVWDRLSQGGLEAVEIRHLGAATRTDVPEGSAVGGRQAAYSAGFVWTSDRSLFAQRHPQEEALLRERLAPWICPQANINFAARIRDRAHFDSCWPEDIRARLERVRHQHDPDSVFAPRWPNEVG